MANKEQQIKNSLIYLLPVIARNLLPFVGLGIFTRILTKQDYGVLALAHVYSIFVAGLANMGMTTAYKRNYFQYQDDRIRLAQLHYSILSFVLLNFLLVFAITLFFQGAISKLITGSVVHGNIIFGALCAQCFSSMSHYYTIYFINAERATDFAFWAVAGSILTFVISLFFVAYLRIGIIGLVYAQLISWGIIFVILSYKFTKILAPSLNGKIFYEALKIAYPLTPRVFFGVISTQFDKYMIGLLASVGGVGIYSIGQRVSNLVFTFMTAIGKVFFPQVFQRMFALGETGKESIGRYLNPFAYVCILFALVVSLFSEEVISVLTPPSYHGAIEIVSILAMYYGFLFFGKITGPQLIFKKKMFTVSLLSMMTLGLNVALNIPFIMKWGVVGAAWATLFAGLISVSVSFSIAQHHYKINWEYRKIGAIFLAFSVSFVLIVLLRAKNVDYYLILLTKLVLISLYIYIGIKIKVITSDNLSSVKNAILTSVIRKGQEAVT